MLFRALLSFAALCAMASPSYAAVTTLTNQSAFESALAGGFTLVDTSSFTSSSCPTGFETSCMTTITDISPILSDANFFGPDAGVRNDDLIVNGQGFHGMGPPHVGLNFLGTVNGVGVTSNAIDGGKIQLFSGPNGTGTLIAEISFGGQSSDAFTGVIAMSPIASAVFTCDFNSDLKCGLRDPIYGRSTIAGVPAPGALFLVTMALLLPLVRRSLRRAR